MTEEEFTTIVDLIRAEVARQDKKWGACRMLDHRTWVTVLTEEVGEVARAVLEPDTEQYLVEVVQVAAVAVQMLWGDLRFGFEVKA